MIIEITEDDVATARRSEECHCPIARALSRLYPGNRFAVYEDAFEVNDATFKPTEAMIAFIDFFDDTGEVNALTVDVPDITAALLKEVAL